jgi:D-lactate dehydrogenase
LPEAAPAPDGLLGALEEAVPGGVTARLSDRLAMAHDASHYLLTPAAVVTPRTADEVAALLRATARQGSSLTFRSGGTSLSGQAGGSGVLVDVRRHFGSITVLDDGLRVRVQPGAVVRAVNLRLQRSGRKLGPDPASESACTIGGVIANNSSGMACGTELNSYATLDSAVLVLPGGTVLDTGAPDADEVLVAAEPEVATGLLRLRDQIRADPDAVAEIRRLYAIKNTMGYGLNSFLDHDRPAKILEHLMVGSEGTLGFVAEATFRTVPAHPCASTGLLVFARLADATAAIPALRAAGFATVELLDATSLRVGQTDPQADDALRGLVVADHAALLVELQAPDAATLATASATAREVISDLPLALPADLSPDVAVRAALWHIRKGLYAAVAGHRPSGTTALLEDIAVPVERLLATCEALTALFTRHGYADSVIFGHALHGNLHFLLNEHFDDPASVRRYLAFTEDLVDLVLAQGGTLKAEHGTGRIMAPYVRRQFGDELFAVMVEVKRLLDPDGLLGPGVLLNEDASAIVADVKPVQPVEAEVDRCVECGYCEPVCPSRDLTTTPRRRIVLRREIARARALGQTAVATELERDYDYDAIETCAVDGLCQTACPVLINTGDLVARLRAEDASRPEAAGWAWAARHWGGVARAGSAALTGLDVLPGGAVTWLSDTARRVVGADTVPRYDPALHGGAVRRPRPARQPVAIYLPACIGTIFGSSPGPGVGEAFLELCDRAGVEVRVPEGIEGLCCGTPWKSKGMRDGHAAMRERVVATLAPVALAEGEPLPLVVDAASCTEGFRTLLTGAPSTAAWRVVDAVQFTDEVLLPRLPVGSRRPSLALHPTCSSVRLGLDPALRRVAAAAATTVVVPQDWGCCGFAGDRGLLHPELTAAATAPEAAEVRTLDAHAYASLNRTCELGMTRATGRPYRHVLEVLADAQARRSPEGRP